MKFKNFPVGFATLLANELYDLSDVARVVLLFFVEVPLEREGESQTFLLVVEDFVAGENVDFLVLRYVWIRARGQVHKLEAGVQQQDHQDQQRRS